MDLNWREMLVPGSVIGNMRIIKRLGSGGMGDVFLAEDPKGSRCAVKVLDPAVSGTGSEFPARFRREAEFAMGTRHPNVVEVYGAARDESTGLCYLVMEYMPGGSLRDVLNANPGGLPVETVVSVAKDISRALVLMEDSGMVHRDIKPDNVLLSSDGVAKLTDLGISRFSPGDGGDVRATQRDAVIGTPAYMAPEQMLDSHAVDARADVYSLGVVIYELLAGRRPNHGDGAMRTLAKAIEGMVFPDVRTFRPDVPAELAELVGEMTLPDPVARPSSARFVLDRLSRREREVPSPACAADAPRPWYRDRQVLYAITGMLLAVEALVLAIARVSRGT